MERLVQVLELGFGGHGTPNDRGDSGLPEAADRDEVRRPVYEPPSTSSGPDRGPRPGTGHYVGALTELGWTEAEPAFRDDTSGRADFVDGDRRLEVSATTATDQVEGDPAGEVVQYSLTLRT